MCLLLLPFHLYLCSVWFAHGRGCVLVSLLACLCRDCVDLSVLSLSPACLFAPGSDPLIDAQINLFIELLCVISP